MGSHLVRRWSESGHRVTVLARDVARNAGLASLSNVTVVPGALRDRALLAEALPGHDILVHNALVWGAPEDDLELEDVRAGARLFEAAGAGGVKAAIFTSSTAVHRPFLPRMDETSPLRPEGAYAATKAAGELVLGAVARQHGMRFLALRLAPVIGGPAFPGAPFKCDGRFAALMDAARAGRDLTVQAGEARQLIDAEQAAEVYARAVAAPFDDDVVIAAADDAVSWEVVARRTLAACPSTSRLLFTGEPPAPPHYFDVGKLERTLGLRFRVLPRLDAHLAEVARRARASQAPN